MATHVETETETERLIAERLLAEWLLAERVVATGTVKWFSAEDGYGFISPDESDDDLFVESANIADGGADVLTAGDRVRFVVCVGRAGLQAVGVVLAEVR
jgi:cold shock protein